MFRPIALTVLGLGLVFGGYAAWKSHDAARSAQAMAAYRPPPSTVATAPVQPVAWQKAIRTTGVLKAGKGVELDARTSGLVSAVHFESGQRVRAGDLLVQLDDTIEQAQLRSANAVLRLSQRAFGRQQELRNKQIGSQAEFEVAREKIDVDRAEVDRIEDLIEQKRLRAPFDGVLGLRDIEVGQHLPVGTRVVDLQSTQTMRLRFFVPERHVNQVRLGGPVTLRVDTYPGDTFGAKVTAVNADVSGDIRAQEIEAVLDNGDGRLVPGMFAEVSIAAGEPVSSPAVPESALMHSLYGDAVYVVIDHDKPSPTVKRRGVKVGDSRDGQVQIVDGLKPGEQVVVAGQNKLHDGAAIRVDNSVLPVTGGPKGS